MTTRYKKQLPPNCYIDKGKYIVFKKQIKGVHFDKFNNKWVAKTTRNKKRIFLGSYADKNQAIEAINEY